MGFKKYLGSDMLCNENGLSLASIAIGLLAACAFVSQNHFSTY